MGKKQKIKDENYAFPTNIKTPAENNFFFDIEIQYNYNGSIRSKNNNNIYKIYK